MISFKRLDAATASNPTPPFNRPAYKHGHTIVKNHNIYGSPSADFLYTSPRNDGWIVVSRIDLKFWQFRQRYCEKL